MVVIGIEIELTVTLLHALQLSVSFDSIIAFAKVALLSAQTRTEYVPGVLKIWLEEVTVQLSPAARSAREFTERAERVHPPFAAEAT